MPTTGARFHVVQGAELVGPKLRSRASAQSKAHHWSSSFAEAKGVDGKGAAGKCANSAEAEEENEDADADATEYNSREQAIHEAVTHAEKASEIAKNAAELILEAANEAMQARRVLDAHDVIAIENQTQADVAKAEIARGLEQDSIPWYMCALPPPPLPSVVHGSRRRKQARDASSSSSPEEGWRSFL